MNMERMLTFLSALEFNNTRDWFHANDAWYREAKAEFEALVGALLPAVRAIDPIVCDRPAKELCFRLMRDTRFSKDKSPYSPAFRAHIGATGKMPIPCGYFISLRAGDRSFLGGGLFADFPESVKRVRDAIAADGAAFGRMRAEMGLPVHGDALKRVPAGYDPDHPEAAYLKHKNWYAEYPLSDALVLRPDLLIPEVARACGRMRPLNDFLNKALEGIEMPKRGKDSARNPSMAPDFTNQRRHR